METRVSPEICKICDIDTIKQQRYYFCAAACLKMCLNLDIDQEVIYQELNSKTEDKDSWYADPNSVYYFLNKYGNYKRLSNLTTTTKEATEWILSNLIHNDSPGPMLVSHGKHWVVYAGYQMTMDGKPSGLYVKDPWPSTVSLQFFPFSDYFFDEYFTLINVPGPLKDKTESFIQEDVSKCINIEIDRKPKYGGMKSFSEIEDFKNDILIEDLNRFGFNNYRLIKNGGVGIEDIEIFDFDNNPKFILTFVEVNDSLTVSVIDSKTYSVIGMMEYDDSQFKLYNKYLVKKELKEIYEIDIDIDKIRYIYDKSICNSCFEPVIKIGESYFNILRGINFKSEVIDKVCEMGGI